jgi:branched-chain amino acid transport system ATP-binding protein
MLVVEDVWAAYDDAAPVLRGVSLRIEAREIVAVLGANGAGKSTLLRAISGLIPIQRGRVVFDGRDVSAMPPHRRVTMGLIHVPEGRQVLPGLTVQENLLLGGYVRRHDRGALDRAAGQVYELFPILRERVQQLSRSLSGGEQQMLALGRALMAGPRLLLLDEPSLGLAPLVVRRIFEVIAFLRDQGIPILLVEQNAKKAIELADRGVVLRRGNVVIAGPAADLLASQEVRAAYLGAESHGVSRSPSP